MRSLLLILCLLGFKAKASENAAATTSTPQMSIYKPSDLPSTRGPSETFTGNVKVTLLSKGDEPSNLSSALVCFEKAARSAWHVHPKGQLLVVTKGSGLIQQEGLPIRKLKDGDVVWTPPNVKHWHGGAPKSSVCHLAIQESLNGKNVEWLSKVADAEYVDAK